MLRLRCPLVAWLVLAIVAYGPSSVLLQMLGPAHRHEVPLAPVSAVQTTFVAGIQDMFRDLRAWRAQLRAQWLGDEVSTTLGHDHTQVSAHAHPHSVDAVHADGSAAAARSAHAEYSRHHHDPGDATVVALDGGPAGQSDAASQASGGSATLPLALASYDGLPALPAVLTVWPPTRRERWADIDAHPPERPPRT